MDASVKQFAIRVSDLVVGFGRRVVINHLSLDVRRGEILGLVGASGGGKSVLMRTIIGLIPRQSGEIEVMGAKIGSTHDRGTQAAAGRWGILFQQGALFSSLTARQNIQFPLRENLALSDALLDEIATAKLEMVGLTPEDGDKFPSELSGGMLPDGAAPFVGKMSEDVSIKFDQPGIYGVKCLPHYGMGMVAMVVVGTPTNEDQAKAVPQVGKAKQAFAALFDKLAANRTAAK